MATNDKNTDSFDELKKALGDIFGREISKFVSGLQKVFDGLGKLFTPPVNNTEKTTNASKLNASIDALNKAIDRLTSVLGNKQGPNTSQSVPNTSAAPAAPPASTEASEEAGAGLEGLAIVAGGAAIAVTAVVAGASAAIGKITEFVAAFAPADILVLNQMLRNLSATIGQAVEPIIVVFTNVVKQVTGLVAGPLQQLRPIIQELADTVAAYVIPIVRLLVQVFEALLPVIRVFSAIIELGDAVLQVLFGVIQVAVAIIGAVFTVLEAVLSPVISLFKAFVVILKPLQEGLQILSAFIQAVGETIAVFINTFLAYIGKLFGIDIAKGAQGIADAMRTVIKALVLFTAYLLKTFGGDFGAMIVAKWADALSPKSGQVAAPGASQIEGFTQIANDMATAAFSAVGGGDTKESDNDFLRDIAGSLKQVESGKLPEQITKMVDALNTIAEVLQHPLKTIAASALEPVNPFAPNNLANQAGAKLDKWLDQLFGVTS